MKAELKPKGCTHAIGTVFSLGLLPILNKPVEKQLPEDLGEDAVTLRDGRRIRWADFTRMHVTDIYVAKVFAGRLYQLWHGGGRIHFQTNKFANGDAVEQFVRSHLPPTVVNPSGEPGRP